MIVKDHIEAVEQCEDYKGDEPSYPGTYDIYTVYACTHCESQTYTLDSNLDPSFELKGEIHYHMENKHPEEL